MKAWVWLGLAILSEVVATSALKMSDGFTRPLPSVVVVFGYGMSFYLLALVLKVIPVAIVYGMWSGCGIALIALIGWLVFEQPLSWVGASGLGLIVIGTVVLQYAAGQ